MQDDRTTRAQLVSELAKLRQRVAELEAAEAERKWAEEALRESEEKFRLLAETSLFGIYAYREKFVYVNPAFEPLTGYTVAELLGMNFWELVHPDSRDLVRQRGAARLRGEKVPDHYEIKLVRKDGDERWINAAATVVQLGGEPTGIGILADITERKRMEAALYASQERYRRIVETAREGIWILDVGGKTTFVNQRMTEMLGYMAGDMLSAPLFAFVDEKDYALAADLLERHRRGISEQHEFRFRRRDGTDLWAILEASPILDEHGKPAGTLAMVTDITERKGAETELHIALEKYRVLFESFPLGISITDAAGNLVEANRESERLLGVPREDHTRRKYDGPEWRIVRPDGTPMPPNEYASVRALREKRLVENVEMGIVKGGGEITWISVTAAPIPLEGYGVAIAYGDITERKRAEDALHRSEDHYRRLVESSGDMVFSLDRAGVFHTAGGARLQEFGLTSKDLVGRPLYDIFPEEEARRYQQKQLQVFEGGTAITYESTFEFAGLTKTDLTTIYPIAGWQGEIELVGVVCRDITERKRAEEQIRFLSAIAEQTTDSILVTDTDYRIIYANEAAQRLFGYTGEELAGQKPDILNAEPEAQSIQERIYTDVASGNSYLGACLNRRKDGSTFICEFKVTPMRDADGCTCAYIGVQRDITERKRVEEALRETKDQLEAILHAIADGVTVLDANERLIYANDVVALAAGYPSAEDMLRSYDPVHFAEQYSLIDEAGCSFPTTQLPNRQVLQGKPGQQVVLGYRNKSTGVVRWSVVQARPVFDKQGKVQFVVTVMHDITERKRAEEALRESEQRFRRLYERAPLGYQSLDAEGRLVDVNLAWLDLLGYSREEVIGRWFGDFLAPQEVEAFKQRFPRFKAAGEVHVDLEMVQRAGSTIIVHIDGRIGDDEHGQFKQTHCILTDITVRKQAEARIAYQANLLAQVSDAIVASDEQYRLTAWNAAAEALYGWKAEEVLGRYGLEITCTEWADADADKMRCQIAETGQWRGEATQARRDGTRVPVEVASMVLRDETGRITGYVSVNRDITERKRAEQEIRHMASFPQLGPLLILEVSKEGQVIFCNPAMRSALQVFNIQDARAMLPDDIWTQLAADQLAPAQYYREIEMGGRVFGENIHLTPEFNSVRVYANDITERKRAEEALRESEKRYHIVSELTSDFAGAFRIALDGTIMREWLTGAYSRITGFNPGEMDTHGIWVTFVHPEDMRVALRHLQTLFSGQSDVCELRIVTASGEVRWLSNYGRPVWDEAQGRVIRIYSASQDITERKQAEERARREAARAKALARVAARLNAQLDLDTVLSAVCEETAHALGVPVASVMLYEPERKVFRLAGIYGLPLKVCEQFTPVPWSLYEEYRKQRGSLFVIPDLQQAGPSRPNLELYARYNIRTTVAAGMVRKDALVGALNIHTVGDVRTFDDDELALLQGLADQAAQALVNARLFDEVEQQHKLIRPLAARLAEAEEAERRRLARELHDRVGQSLTALSINLNIIRSQLPADSPQAAARLDDSLRLVEETVEHTRDVMADLRPPVLDDYGLLAALRWYAGQRADTLAVAVQVEGQELSPRLPPAVETALFRIAQEALNNVTRHAHATQASVRLEAAADTACLTIADDGVGFDPAAKRRPGEPPFWGLLNMRERAEAVGGRLRVESAPGQGTRVVVKVPR